MILKGSRIANIKHARQMAMHLFKDENTQIEVWDSIGGGQDRQAVEQSLVDMQLMTKMTQGNTGIYSVAINPREGEKMTPEQWEQSVDAIEKEFGFSGQMRVMVYHEKEGRPHLHVSWSLVDQEKGKLLDPRQDRPRLQGVAIELEKEFHHELTRRTANDNTLEITDKDRAREAKTGKSVKDRKTLLSGLWRDTKSGEEFIKAAQEQGYIIAQGDRARIVAVDRDGEPFGLARQLPKLVKAKDVRERLAGIDLPSFAKAQELQAERTQEATEKVAERDSVENDPHGTKILNDPLEAAQERFAGHKKAFQEQEAERLARDDGGKSWETATGSRDGETLSPDGTRKQRKVSANTLLGVMAAYTNLSEQERQEIRQELQERFRKDQETLEQRQKEQERDEVDITDIFGTRDSDLQDRDIGNERD